MNILIVGSGAREHAIARALKRSPKNPQLFCLGSSNNPGIQLLTEDYKICDICDPRAVAKEALHWHIQMAIIGPEAPLEKGIADYLWEKSISVIGPKQTLARIESSKAFTRDLLKKYHIKGSPEYRVFTTMAEVLPFLNSLGENQYVIKADGLMGGKGVKVAGDHLASIKEALQFCQELVSLKQSFVIEEKLVGQEFSLLSFCDGEQLISMPLIQDHKRAYKHDLGPNTGGMGSYSDANHSLPFLTAAETAAAYQMNEAVLKALSTECQEKYIGILYGSFIATKDGVRLIEYNARFGDPEAMNALAILETDLVSICEAMVTGTLKQLKVTFANKATVCKYAVPVGYPDLPLKNAPINVADIQNPEQLYYSSVDLKAENLYTLGGRALAVLGIGQTLAEAEMQAEQEINRIQGQLFHREDIGTSALINSRVQQMQELRQCD